MDPRDVLIPLSLIGILGGSWAWARRQERRFRGAIDAVLARHPGSRHEPGGRFSGGTLFVKIDGVDVALIFDLAHSARGASTTASRMLPAPVPEAWALRGRAALDREPRLAPFRGLFGLGLEIGASANLLRVKVPGIVRDADRLVELGRLAVSLSPEVLTG
jgi:hypothetical protein